MTGIDRILELIQQAFAQGLGLDAQLLLLVLVFASVFLAVLGTAQVTTSRESVERRLAESKADSLAADAAAGRKASWAMSLLERLSERISPKGKDQSHLRRKLIRAGYMSPKAVQMYFTVRVLLAVLLPGTLLLFSPIASRQLSAEQILWLSALLCISGIYFPSVWVSHRTSRRQQAFREAFPDALDMLLVSVEAGLSLDAAINRVGKEIGKAHPLLGEQFELTGLELRAGKSREEALRNFADRVGIDEVTSLVTLLIQSDAFGTSIAQALRVHADEMRVKRMLAAEEKAHKLPVKLSVPLVTLILPALLIVILSPAIINIIRMLLPVLNRTDFGPLTGD